MNGHRSVAMATVAGALAAALAGARAPAQMPGQPVLQNAWANPGITVAVNAGFSEAARGYAAAAAWSPRSARLQASVGLGALDPDVEGAGIVTSLGARVMVPIPILPRTGSFGAGGFAGVGWAQPAEGRLITVPIGVAIGYRRALGATRGISGYVAPFYSRFQRSVEGASRSESLVRVSAGIDFAATPAIGISAGYETGGEADEGRPGPSGGVFGVGVSYLLRRR
jgi:hypothetical protein